MIRFRVNDSMRNDITSKKLESQKCLSSKAHFEMKKADII